MQLLLIMTTRLLNELRSKADLVPTCEDYRALLEYASSQTGRDRYNLFPNQGTATYAQWAEYLEKSELS